MSDLIVREDAIRDIRSMDVCVMYDDTCSTEDAVEKAIVATKRNAIFGLERMPSVEPEQSIAEWQKDFREYINMLNIPRDDYNGIMEYINDLPSASTELSTFSDKLWKIAYERGKAEGRKKGKWIYGEKSGQDGWYCSECGGFIPWDYDFYGLDNIDFIEDFKTCPFCDSKMVSYTGADTKEGEEDG